MEVLDSDREGENPFLSFDLLCEILHRVDAVTLATASCVSTSFRRVCARESFWERLCNSQWPATIQARELIIQSGGYRKFVSLCHPSLSGSGISADWEPPCRGGGSKDEDEVDRDPSPSNYVSMIDVKYKGVSMLSRVVHGFPNVEEFEWFESSPFRFELLQAPDEVDGVRKDEEGVTVIAAGTHPEWVSYEEERKLGSMWKALNGNMTASWILFNKETGEMANFASCEPVGGQQQWPCEDEFLLHFGTFIPGTYRDNDTVHCNISLKAQLDIDGTISITELGMRLENLDGVRLYGMESVELLDRALSCDRTISQSKLTKSYDKFHARQLAKKEVRIALEHQHNFMAAFISGICVFVCLCYILM
jgi:hypothetical protein